MRYALYVLLLCSSVFGAELNPIDLAELDSEDFDIRNTASHRIAEYNETYIRKMIEVADRTKAPEIRWRLYRAARTIHDREVLPRNPRWQRMHGYLGLSVSCVEAGASYPIYTYADPPDDIEMMIITDVSGDGPCWDSFSTAENDVITHIDGLPVKEFKHYFYRGELLLKAGVEVTFTVRRYKESSVLLEIARRDEADTYVERTVKITPAWKRWVDLDWKEVDKLAERIWNTYLNL